MAKTQSGRESKPHIGIFGRTNSGKSTLFNFLTGSSAAMVSPTAGTTTDCVRRSVEIIGQGPVIMIDTPGFDDGSTLGRERERVALDAVVQVDVALLVFTEWADTEAMIYKRLSDSGVPVLHIYNDLHGVSAPLSEFTPDRVITVDLNRSGESDRDRLLDRIAEAVPPEAWKQPQLFSGLAREGSHVVLVCPIDQGAPAGRLILPQVQAIRSLLDIGATAIVVQPGQLSEVINTSPIELVVTDSQVYRQVRDAVADNIEVTTFSILLAAAKGDYQVYMQGLDVIANLRDGDRVLIAENCLHQTSCDDIGRVKIPAWLSKFTGKELIFEHLNGISPLPDNLTDYALIVQCGGCMATPRQVRMRIRQALEKGVPITNYGMLIRHVT